MGRFTTIGPVDLAIEKELRGERASALGRAGAALEAAMAVWRVNPAPGTRAEAQRRLWYLVVHREALGLYSHRDVYETFGVPRAWWY